MACKNGNCCRNMPPEYDPPKSDFDADELAWREIDEQQQIDITVASRPMKAFAYIVPLIVAVVIAAEVAILFLTA
jgi:hypothetical protein